MCSRGEGPQEPADARLQATSALTEICWRHCPSTCHQPQKEKTLPLTSNVALVLPGQPWNDEFSRPRRPRCCSFTQQRKNLEKKNPRPQHQSYANCTHNEKKSSALFTTLRVCLNKRRAFRGFAWGASCFQVVKNVTCAIFLCESVECWNEMILVVVRTRNKAMFA